MQKVLVLGARGFIGRHISRQLNMQGFEVTGLGNGEWAPLARSQWGVEDWHESEINTKALMELKFLPDIIVHAAGGSSVPFSIEHPLADFERTVDSTAQVLEYARKVNPNVKLIFLSSAAVYGKVKQLPIREDTYTDPLSPYGFHKSISETLCKAYALQYGLRVAVVRLFSVYGNGLRKQLLWDACHKCLNNELIFHGIGSETRDWVHVYDVARLISQLTSVDFESMQIINCGSGRQVQVSDILNLIFTKLNFPKSPIFNNNKRIGDPDHYCADVSLANSLGWYPEIEWQKGIAAYVDWFLGEHRSG